MAQGDPVFREGLNLLCRMGFRVFAALNFSLSLNLLIAYDVSGNRCVLICMILALSWLIRISSQIQ